MATKTKAQEFFDSVLARVPEADREAVRSAYSGAMDEITGQQKTLEEQTAAVRDTAAKQTEWWNNHKGAVAENLELKKKLEAGGGTGLSADELTKTLAQMEDRVLGTGLGLITKATRISTGHYQEFGEVLDMDDLAHKAIKANMPLEDFYNSTVATRRQERSAATRTKELDDARAAGRKEGVDETVKTLGSTHMPFPGSQGRAPVTTLSGLKPRPEGSAPPDVVSDAVATATEVFNRQP